MNVASCWHATYCNVLLQTAASVPIVPSPSIPYLHIPYRARVYYEQWGLMQQSATVPSSEQHPGTLNRWENPGLLSRTVATVATVGIVLIARARKGGGVQGGVYRGCAEYWVRWELSRQSRQYATVNHITHAPPIHPIGHEPQGGRIWLILATEGSVPTGSSPKTATLSMILSNSVHARSGLF